MANLLRQMGPVKPDQLHAAWKAGKMSDRDYQDTYMALQMPKTNIQKPMTQQQISEERANKVKQWFLPEGLRRMMEMMNQ